jgi:hypothetical protein
MSLSKLHTFGNKQYGQKELYEKYRDEYIKDVANAQKSDPNSLETYNYGSKGIALGHGYNLISNVDTLKEDLKDHTISKQGDISKEEALEKVHDLIKEFTEGTYRSDLNNAKTRRDALVDEINGYIALNSQADADRMLAAKIEKLEDSLDGMLSGHNLIYSKERAAAIACMYRVGENNVHNLTESIKRGDRPEAWYEIRYNTNADKSYENAALAVRESDMFDLHSAEALSVEEAKSIKNMHDLHKDDIKHEESRLFEKGDEDKSMTENNPYIGDNSISSKLESAEKYLAESVKEESSKIEKSAKKNEADRLEQESTNVRKDDEENIRVHKKSTEEKKDKKENEGFVKDKKDEKFFDDRNIEHKEIKDIAYLVALYNSQADPSSASLADLVTFDLNINGGNFSTENVIAQAISDEYKINMIEAKRASKNYEKNSEINEHDNVRTMKQKS